MDLNEEHNLESLCELLRELKGGEQELDLDIIGELFEWADTSQQGTITLLMYIHSMQQAAKVLQDKLQVATTQYTT